MRKIIGESLGITSAAFGALCPICYIGPALASAGMGSTLFFTALYFKYVLLGLIAFSALGYFFNYRTHKNIFPLLLTIIGGFLMYYGQYINFSFLLTYIGAFGLIAAAIIDFKSKRNTKDECKTCIPKNVNLK